MTLKECTHYSWMNLDHLSFSKNMNKISYLVKYVRTLFLIFIQNNFFLFDYFKKANPDKMNVDIIN